MQHSLPMQYGPCSVSRSSSKNPRSQPVAGSPARSRQGEQEWDDQEPPSPDNPHTSQPTAKQTGARADNRDSTQFHAPPGRHAGQASTADP